jgi:hypothetical protein
MGSSASETVPSQPATEAEIYFGNSPAAELTAMLAVTSNDFPTCFSISLENEGFDDGQADFESFPFSTTPVLRLRQALDLHAPWRRIIQGLLRRFQGL